MSDHPQLEHKEYPWFWIHRNLGKRPRWEFPDLLFGNNLRCHRLTFDNYDQLWPLLAEGDTTYVTKGYRNREELYRHVLTLQAYTPYSGTQGAVDYIIVDTPGRNEEYNAVHSLPGDRYIRLAEDERILGVLHLYDLSHERLEGRMQNPFLGIQLIDSARGQRVADRAMDLLEYFVEESYPEAEGVMVTIKPDNERSQKFFRRRKYRDAEDYAEDRDVFLVKVFDRDKKERI